ncbi:twin-arginine translocase TatA/TatE family subunit [Billgrantia desiderata]|uniref:Sec-independent protein translocase protein TatA n=1 Tax=Billgrantia desiderata TaxID=52021 RepID=A0ABS9B997_9GAMM|nr:twin-arginine translocase TatA/TatE family subunit [Halomonas desiderata]MCE8030446.1 twin-arginine translocase TatA/TatE family subunit [Halomonas desiderata]MCE8044077.1 twin-arginine translocase TatA/TatE family subunit [Halomonas desiderata]MCE8048651.1 twin-arginine translocase TatA/TatE family subunit [Halomonas desiderata]OUE40389.1 hypothetical protein BZY95_14025 [Halomonas desiderata SP1]
MLIVLGIIILIFGTQKLRKLGGDLGGAVKGFKQAMHATDTNLGTKGRGSNLTSTAAKLGH